MKLERNELGTVVQGHMSTTPNYFVGSGDITNDAQLYAIVGGAIDNAVQYCMSRILSDYKELIKDIVYRAYTPEEYQRTYQFLESWSTETQRTGRGGFGTLYQDGAMMQFATSGSYEAPNQHGSFMSGPIGDALTEIIYEGTSGDLFAFTPNQAWQTSRDAWTPLIDELNNGKLDKWFRKSMRQQGFNCTKT